jgi:hypothetical protein
MCCIFKCLTGYVAGWIIFAANVAAAGCLLAGAFAPWLQVSAFAQAASVYQTARCAPFIRQPVRSSALNHPSHTNFLFVSFSTRELMMLELVSLLPVLL